MRRATKSESSLDALLRQMMQQQQRQQSATRVAAIKPAAAASSPSPEEKQSMMKSIEIGGRIYRWSELNQPAVRRQLLPQVEKMIAEFKRDPARLTALGFTEADRQAAIAWTTGQFDGFSEEELYAALPAPAEVAEGEKDVATTLTKPLTPAAPVDGRTAFRELGELMTKPEMRIALQRSRTGQPLDGAQAALVARHDELLAANNAQARLERPPSSAPPPMGVYLGKDVLEFSKNPSQTERRHLAAEHIAKVKADNAHPYWNAGSPEHKAAVLGMKVATEMMQTGDSFVQLNQDGSVQDE